MEHDLGVLSLTAISLGFIHTLVGPDHYLPFVAMSRIGKWSLRKTILITGFCGVGHVLGSVVLGFAGIALGVAVFKIEGIESVRGDIAAWLLLGFGLVYFAWGVRRAFRNKPHAHLHRHPDGTVHRHTHVHQTDHLHPHTSSPHADRSPGHGTGGQSASPAKQGDATSSPARLTPWILFTIFLFGPCEVLIPLVMYPAAQGSMAGVAWVATLFGVVTIGTMTTIVAALSLGIGSIRLARFGRYSHAMAGLVVLVCGAAIKLGL
ncbi:MAG: hypothetical protein ABII12_14815 [Planctomycetota bacterium]